MKRLAIFFVFLMLAMVFIPCVPVMAEPSLVPHEDPEAVQSVMDAYSFLAQYADIFALMSSQHYDNASQLSEQLSHITVPADLSYVINRYNNLTQQLISVLNDLDNTLDRASSLLDQYRLNEAGQELEHAGVLISKAQILLTDLQDATLTLSQRLGVFATPIASKVRQAYSQLQSMLNRLKDLIDLYHTLLDRANQRIEEIKSEKLNPALLTLILNSTRSFVGGYISASGVLTSNGSALDNRAVQLLLDGNQVATTNTNANGTYYAIIRVPYKYVDSVSIYALYSPQSTDKGVYLASVSPTIKVQVLYYVTVLDISVPPIAYPGLSLTVNGNVTSQSGAPLVGRQVTVLLDGVMVAQVQTGQTGVFTTKTTIASQAKLGSHRLEVTVDSQGLYNGASAQKTVTIQKIASTIQVTVPTFAMLPTQLYINGTVTSASNALSDATVQIEFANVSATAKTLIDGTFNLTMDLPLNTIFAGNQNMKISAQPAQPWQAATQRTYSVFVLNSVGIGLALVSSLSVVSVMYLRFAKNKNKKPEATVASSMFTLPVKEMSVIVAPIIPVARFEGIKGKILKAYVDALSAVQAVTKVSLLTNMTLREYLEATNSKIGKAAEPFSELTLSAERSLYSPHTPNDEDAEKASNLASSIRRILNDGTA